MAQSFRGENKKLKELKFQWLGVLEAPVHSSEPGIATVVALNTVGSGGPCEVVAETEGRVRVLAEASLTFKFFL